MIHRSSLFRPSPTFPNYVGYLEKACLFLGQSVAWDTPAVRNVAMALKLSGKSNIRFPNFLQSAIVIGILRHEGPDGEFGLLAYLSYLCALRVPSEALPLRRAYANDALGVFSPQEEKALIGLRGEGDDRKLVLRFSSRKNLPGGCILIRP